MSMSFRLFSMKTKFSRISNSSHVINNVYFWYFSAYLIDKIKINGYYVFKLTEENLDPDLDSSHPISKLNPQSSFTTNWSATMASFLRTVVLDAVRLKETQNVLSAYFLCRRNADILWMLFSSPLVLLLSITIFHKRKRRKIWKARTHSTYR